MGRTASHQPRVRPGGEMKNAPAQAAGVGCMALFGFRRSKGLEHQGANASLSRHHITAAPCEGALANQASQVWSGRPSCGERLVAEDEKPIKPRRWRLF